MGVFEQYTRPLNERERRLLNKRIAAHRVAARRRLLGCMLLMALLLIAIFVCVWIVDKKPPDLVMVILACAGYAVMSVAVYLTLRSEHRADARPYHSVLNRNEAHVDHIQADRMIELEEYEDEGATYAFQVEEDRIVIVTGQDFYKSARFPNTDFSIVEIRDSTGKPVEGCIEKHGEKLKPTRTVPGSWKRQSSVWPEHLQVVRGKLDNLERLLLEQQS